MRRQIGRAVVAGLLAWLVSLAIDVIMERWIASGYPFLEDLVADFLTGIVAGLAYWFWHKYRLSRREKEVALRSLDFQVRESLTSLLLVPEDEFYPALRRTIGQIDAALRSQTRQEGDVTDFRPRRMVG